MAVYTFYQALRGYAVSAHSALGVPHWSPWVKLYNLAAFAALVWLVAVHS